jgi:hypothetical protein
MTSTINPNPTRNAITPNSLRDNETKNKTLDKADQEALKAALDSHLQTAVFESLKRTHQRVNDEFKEALDL